MVAPIEPVALGDALAAAWDSSADRRALVEGDEAWSYRELELAVNERRRALAELGVVKGTRVAFLLGANREWVVSFYALLQAGAVAIPINTTWTARELREGLRLSEAQVILTQSEFKGMDLLALVEGAVPGLAGMSASAISDPELPYLTEVLHQGDAGASGVPGYARQVPPATIGTGAPAAPAAEASDPAMFILTSGSTAFPKPVIHTHGSLGFAFQSLAEAGNVEKDDVWLVTGTTFHVSAYLGFVVPHLRGASAVLMEYFTPERAITLIEEHQANSAWGFDTHFVAIRRHPTYPQHDLSSLRKIWLGSNPASFDEIQKLGADWHGNIYADSETAACSAFFPYNLRHDVKRMKFSHGVPVPGTQVLIVDPETGEEVPAGTRGEICVSGPQLFSGYYNMPEETAQAFLRPGLHRTGDQGWMDEDGFVYYVGRYKETIKSGGENVSIPEVEQTLMLNIDEIEKVVVVGVPDEKWGEMIVALTEFTEEADVPTDELRARAKSHLAAYKVPKVFLRVEPDEWVITPTGKMDRRALLELAKRRLEPVESVTRD